MWRICIILLVAILFGTECGAQTQSDELTPQRLVEYSQILHAAYQCDATLFREMEKVAGLLQLYRAKHGNLPDAVDDLWQDSGKSPLTANPYDQLKAALADEGKDLPGGQDRLSIQAFADGTITTFQRDRLETSPPSSWKDKPGTIHVLKDPTDSYVIWGAGADRLPIKSMESGKVRMICRLQDLQE